MIKFNTARKIFAILNTKQRTGVKIMFFLMFVGMFLETLGIGLVVPAIVLMSQKNLATTYPQILPILQWLGNPSQEQLMVIGMISLTGVYGLKSAFFSFLTWWQAHFTFNVQASLSEKLFTGYLQQPYTFHIERNSAQLIRNIVGEVGLFTNGALAPLLMIATEFFVVFGISLLLFSVEPIGASIIILVFGVAGGGIYRVTKKYLSRWGIERQELDGMRLQHIQQGLGGVKDIKLMGREDDFLKQFEKTNSRCAIIAERATVVQALPRLILEFLAVIGLATLVIVMIGQAEELSTIVPIVGLFAAAAFRLMPSVSRILRAYQSVRFGLTVVNTLYNEFNSLPIKTSCIKTRLHKLQGDLTFDNVSFRYSSSEALSLKDADLTIKKGEMVGFVGESGAGKSTLVDLLLGLLTPENGKVEVDGMNIQKNLRDWQDQIGYVPQTIFLTDDSLRRNIAFGISDSKIDENAIQNAIRSAQLEDFINSLTKGLDTVVGERGVRLSGGQRQRIGIARALYHNPSVLVLDEATSSLDSETERGVMESVMALHGKKTIIIVAHRLSTVEYCDVIFRLERGQIRESGSVSEILKISKN
jgi:ATP-binding cassette, subfamily B, bacterial PglK